MRVAVAALAGSMLFFGGVFVGGLGSADRAASPPAPVELISTEAVEVSPEAPREPRATPRPEVEEIEHEVVESEIEDSSGPGSRDEGPERDDDNSGPGGDGGETPEPDETPTPEPEPSETPEEDHSGPGGGGEDNSGPGGGDDSSPEPDSSGSG